MPSYKTAFGNFLKCEDLQDRPAVVTIDEVTIEEIKSDDGKEKKLVAHFAGKDKALIINRTNAESLEAICGTDDYSAWAGHRIVVYPTTTKFGSKTVPCLRIRAPQAPAPAAVAPLKPAPLLEDELTVDDIPF